MLTSGVFKTNALRKRPLEVQSGSLEDTAAGHGAVLKMMRKRGSLIVAQKMLELWPDGDQLPRIYG